VGQAKPWGCTPAIGWDGAPQPPFLGRVGFRTRGSQPRLRAWGQPEGAHRTPHHTPQRWETRSKHHIRSVPVTEKMSGNSETETSWQPHQGLQLLCWGKFSDNTHWAKKVNL